MSDNDFGDTGLLTLLEGLNKAHLPKITKLKLDRNFAKKSKLREPAIQALIEFFSLERNCVESLSLGGGGILSYIYIYMFAIII